MSALPAGLSSRHVGGTLEVIHDHSGWRLLWWDDVDERHVEHLLGLAALHLDLPWLDWTIDRLAIDPDVGRDSQLAADIEVTAELDRLAAATP